MRISLGNNIFAAFKKERNLYLKEMQNKGLIWTFIVLLTLACLYQLSFTWVSADVESDAAEYGQGNPELEEQYLDSIRREPVYPIFGFTYDDVRQNAINLGLDLKGGMNVTLEVSVADVVRALSSNSTDPDFLDAIELAREKQKASQSDFVTLFAESWKEVAGNKPLVSIFYTLENKDNIDRNATNEEVIAFLKEETDAAFERTFQVLRTRVDLFGVAQPNIQKLEASNRILVELPGVKNKDRVRTLLQGTAKLEFWETYENAEIYPYLAEANEKLRLITNAEGENVGDSTSAISPDSLLTEEADVVEQEISQGDTSMVEEAATDSMEAMADGTDTEEEDGGSILEQLSAETDSLNQDSLDLADQSFEEFSKDNPLFAVLQPAIFQNQEGNYVPGEGPAVGYIAIKDTAKLNEYLRMPEIQAIFPAKLKLLYTAKAYDEEGRFLQVIAIKVNSRDGSAPLEGDVITDAYQSFGQVGGRPEITMKMNTVGAKTWRLLTGDNVGKSIAIVLDDYVYSFPNVNGEIAGGISSIEGDFTIEEAQLIANILKAGKLPAPAKIVQEAVVGPSLGHEAINSGFSSFALALLVVLLYMIFYYGKAGIASDIALLANLFFLVGVVASTNVALTLPGIAGIVLTMGMAVDANVLIYERIREEMRAGKGIRLAITEGYKNAYSSIIDGNVTTLLTGIILWVFGTGPVEGFAKTLVIGILTSLFTSIFITRLIFEWRLKNKKKISIDTKITRNAFQNLNIQFVANRKKYYIISGIVILLGLVSIFTRGFSFGVDFSGGRTFLVRFDEKVSTSDVRDALTSTFVTADGQEMAPEVKTFGEENQVKVTTSYMIESLESTADSTVEADLNKGLQTLGTEYEVMSSQKVGPTIADDIKKSASWAILFSLITIFLYIVFRFQKWQFGLGAIAALLHDVLFVLSIFSLLYGILPFSLDIDEAFIAAILTVLGYSINDTVIVFDRIREYLGLYKKQDFNTTVNGAINSTISRTINTSLTTLFVLLMIFVFGGETIRGFAFALLIGIAVGTYSSIFIASNIVVDMYKGERSK